MPDEPAWYYQLDELVYQAYGHDGHVPALTLRALSRRARRSFLHTAQVEVRERAGDEARCMEIDLCCSIDGQLIVGEAKRAGRLDGTAQQQDRALTRYRELAGRLGASSVVLSTFADAWDAATVKRAQHALGVDGVEFLTHSDLLAQARQHATAPQEVRGDSMSG
jgi:hypothetical protein